MKYLAADGPTLAGGANDRHRAWVEEELQGVDRCDRLALFEAFDCVCTERSRERHVKLTRRRVHLNGKPSRSEDVEHRVVCSHHLSLKYLNSIGSRDLGQLTEQHCAEPTSLKIVRDRKGNLRAMFIDDGIKCMTNDSLFSAAECK